MTNDNGTDDGVRTAHTNAHLAVGLLSDAVGPNTYHQQDVDEAIDHLYDAREAAPEGSETAEHVQKALEILDDMGEKSLDDRQMKVHDALAYLAPVGAGLTDVDDRQPIGAHRHTDEKPTVPVFYYIPPAAADRAIARFNQRYERVQAGAEGAHMDQKTTLRDYVLDEVTQKPAVWVGDEPLGEYAARAGAKHLVIDPDDVE